MLHLRGHAHLVDIKEDDDHGRSLGKPSHHLGEVVSSLLRPIQGAWSINDDQIIENLWRWVRTIERSSELLQKVFTILVLERVKWKISVVDESIAWERKLFGGLKYDIILTNIHLALYHYFLLSWQPWNNQWLVLLQCEILHTPDHWEVLGWRSSSLLNTDPWEARLAWLWHQPHCTGDHIVWWMKSSPPEAANASHRNGKAKESKNWKPLLKLNPCYQTLLSCSSTVSHCWFLLNKFPILDSDSLLFTLFSLEMLQEVGQCCLEWSVCESDQD